MVTSPDRPAMLKRERVYECMTCPVHGNGSTPILHETICGKDCRDTHAYWLVDARSHDSGLRAALEALPER